MIRWVRIVTLLAALAVLIPLVLDFDSDRDLKTAGSMLSKRDPDLALRLSSRALLLGGLDREDRCRARELRAAAALRLGNPAFAMDELGRAIDSCPKRAGAHLLRGELRLAAGDNAAALADLDQGISLALAGDGAPHPSLAKRHAQRGRASLALGKPDQAARDAAAALGLNSREPEAYYLQSMILEASGRPLDALVSMEKAFALKFRPGGPLPFQTPGGDAWTRRVVRLRMKNKVDPVRPYQRP